MRESTDRQILARAALNAPSQVFSQCVPLSARRLFSAYVHIMELHGGHRASVVFKV
jgi:hypothetical protein